MAIRYTITNYSCPHCGKVFKIDSWAQLDTAINRRHGFSIVILVPFNCYYESDIRSSDMPSVGSPFRTCSIVVKNFIL